MLDLIFFRISFLLYMAFRVQFSASIAVMTHKQIATTDALMVHSTITSDRFASEPILDDQIIWIYIGAIATVGFILNSIIICALFKSKCNGKQRVRGSVIHLFSLFNIFLCAFRHINLRCATHSG